MFSRLGVGNHLTDLVRLVREKSWLARIFLVGQIGFEPMPPGFNVRTYIMSIVCGLRSSSPELLPHIFNILRVFHNLCLEELAH